MKEQIKIEKREKRERERETTKTNSNEIENSRWRKTVRKKGEENT